MTTAKRDSAEVLLSILGVARQDERVRAVLLSGSRANPAVETDDFQDYDIVYAVTDVASLRGNDAWLDAFGPRLIMQKPEAMHLFPPAPGNRFTYLMLFEDGNRIDLTLVPVAELADTIASDGLATVLLDKDNRIPVPRAASDKSFHIRPPTGRTFDDCCNEFWWLSTYVAKGLCRGEFFYAAYHLAHGMRSCLMIMLAWEIGTREGFAVNLGNEYKYIPRFLPPDVTLRLMRTYDNGSTAHLHDALGETLALFREASRKVARYFSYSYPDYDDKVSPYLARTAGKKRAAFV
ncbi:MAG: aminoglycoside 6-adenylyltransferase [Methylobacteriaceae bacterium]|jgi:aminoglycoside 6-adenylyltransferase|nr:aminoglycoside 6-adenylyltransferase [Methylobacteriaceae bacterium]